MSKSDIIKESALIESEDQIQRNNSYITSHNRISSFHSENLDNSNSYSSLRRRSKIEKKS